MEKFKFYSYIENWIIKAYNNTSKRPVFFGLNAPQGAGKTHLSQYLVSQFKKQDIIATSISIDDFYLTNSAQKSFSNQYPKNPYFQQRGYPGTHDINLGINTLKLLSKKNEENIKLPKYDKSAYQGQGDRKPQTQWEPINNTLDLIILEGWMLGFRPQPHNKNQNFFTNLHMSQIQEKLSDYSQWLYIIDYFIYLKAIDVNYVSQWRIEAEENMKAKGLNGMTKKEIENYIKKFIPAYKLYQDSITPVSHPGRSLLNFELGKNRLPI